MKSLVHWRAVFQGLLILALTAYAPGARNEEAADVAAPPTSTSGDFEGLRGLLESRGWKVERTSDGSTLLIPVRETAEAQNQMLPVQPDLTTVDGIDRLRNALEARSWRVERGAGGSLLLIPATRPAAQEPATVAPLTPILPAATHSRVPSTSKTADCARKHQDISVTAGVELPVNTRKEAWQISVNWLWESGYRELTVGNIRDINWIYLVTIIDPRPPYTPRNELIINKRTGRLLASF